MNMRIYAGVVALLVLLVLGQSQAQSPPSRAGAKALLSVRGEVPQPLRLEPNDLARMPRRTVTTKDRDGKEAVFDGVLVAEILKKAGVKQGKDLRGELLATYLLVEAADGYRVIFSLPELDEAFTDRVVLLADRKDGKPLSDREGPFRIVAPDEKRPARWIRQVVALTVRRSKKEPTPPATSGP